MGTFLAMTLKSAIKLPVLALASALMLMGCSSDQDQKELLKSLRGSLPSFKKAAPPAKPDPARVLAATTGPVNMITQKSLNNAMVLTIEIAQNGPYRTHATSTKQSLTFRQGMATATRGLGHDLMSSSVNDSLRLISARREGKAKRVMRYLDSANTTLSYTFECDMYVTGATTIRQGVVSASVTEMTENCVSDTQKFTNTYLVDRGGMILSSEQWLGPNQGYFAIQVLRR
ncbi:MAG: hypothetical protein CML69_12555 [Rhodobacteraceae bacterium]|nr:hypothetical protein [Paracoccaceae bacterium]